MGFRFDRGYIGKLAVAVSLSLGVSVMPVQRAAAQDAFEWPRYFNVSTLVVGTATHSLAVAWTSRFQADTGVRARPLPAPNLASRVSWLQSGEARLSMLQPEEYFSRMNAEPPFTTAELAPTDTRLVNINVITPWGFMVRGDSEIQAFADVGPSTRIAFYESPLFIDARDALLAYTGMSLADANLVEVGGYVANTNVVVEGRADVTFTSPLSGVNLEAEASPSGIRWLPVPTPEENREAFARYRAIQSGQVARPAEAGVPSALGVNLDHAYQVNQALAEDDADFIYHLVRWLDENLDSYKDDFTYGYMMGLDQLIAFLDQGALVPLHDGVVRYLQERELWTEAYQVRQDALVALAQAQVAGYQAALVAARDAGIVGGPDTEEWQAFWTTYRQEHDLPLDFGQAVLNLNG